MSFKIYFKVLRKKKKKVLGTRDTPEKTVDSQVKWFSIFWAPDIIEII